MTGVIVLIFRILITAALYGFLAWAFYTIWRDLHGQSIILSSRQVPSLSLTYQLGGETLTRHFAISEVTIGRDPNCTCPVEDDTVSVRHAQLTYHHSQWWVEDLHSTNGTTLNQERVFTPTVIISGDELLCGRVALLITLGNNRQKH
jgi:pSer/pThr/pTyr-binding forkhead associated (FHA) protein